MDLQTDYIINEDTVYDIIVNYHFFNKMHVDSENIELILAFFNDKNLDLDLW